MLTGSTVKPVADKNNVSHEELAYVVDSTASPVATILPFNAWPVFVAGLVVGTVPVIADLEAAERFFFSSLKYNFYAMFAVTGTLLFSLGKLPWISLVLAGWEATYAVIGPTVAKRFLGGPTDWGIIAGAS